MNNYAIDLNLPFKPLKPESERFISERLSDESLDNWSCTSVDIKLFNPEFVNFLNKLGLTLIDNSLLFTTKPNEKSLLHYDGESHHNFCAINYVWNSNNHKMIWYENDDIGKKYGIYGPVNMLDESKSKELYQHTINCSVVKYGIPHQIFNYDPKNFRLCLTISIIKNGDEDEIRNKFGGLDFEEAKTIFADYIQN
jgi:hypothetical protein